MRPSAQPFLWKWVLFAWEWKIISTSKAEHLTSFWYRGMGELGNGLFHTSHCILSTQALFTGMRERFIRFAHICNNPFVKNTLDRFYLTIYLPLPLCSVRAFNTIVSRHTFRQHKKVNLKMVKDRQVDPLLMVRLMSWAECNKTMVRGLALFFSASSPSRLSHPMAMLFLHVGASHSLRACLRSLEKREKITPIGGGGGGVV